MFFVYIFKSINYKKSYVGHTNNLNRRLIEHNSGKNIYTRKYKPWRIIYFEKLEEEQFAIKRENYFKSRSGRRKMKKIFESCPVV